MDVLTEVPNTHTKLRINADRDFDGAPGDSTMRITGQTQDGSPVCDLTYVECSTEEAALVGWFLRSLRRPAPELLEEITKEVHAAFQSRLTGRDAHQIAELAWAGISESAREKLGVMSVENEQVEKLAERFERAAARSRTPERGTSMSGTETAARRS